MFLTLSSPFDTLKDVVKETDKRILYTRRSDARFSFMDRGSNEEIIPCFTSMRFGLLSGINSCNFQLLFSCSTWGGGGGSFSKMFGQFEERKKGDSVLGMCYLSDK